MYRFLMTMMVAGMCASSTGQVPTLNVTTRIVVLDISVTDAAGHPVTDLLAKDFRVYENSDRQTIRSFEAPPTHIPAPRADSQAMVLSSADLPKIGNSPITIIVLDELNMPFGEEVYARDQVAKWLASQPKVLPQPTMLVAVTYKDLHVLVDTTQDRDTLAAILRRHYATYPWRSYNAGTVGGTASDLLAASLRALEQIAQATRGIPGRKNVIWVGDGFPTVLTTDVAARATERIEAELRQLSGQLLQARVALSILGPTIKPPNRPTNLETQSDTLGGAAQMGDTVGGAAQPAVVPLGGSLAFADLAAPTGGRAYRGRNDLDRELAQTVAEGTLFYTLSYTPTDTSDDEKRYRKIRVDVLRPGLHLQTRDGYFPQAAPDHAAPPTRQQLAFDLVGAGTSTLPYTGLHIVPVRVDATHWNLAVRAPEMGWEQLPDGQLKANTVVLAMYFDRRGRLLGRNFDSIGASTRSTQTQLLGQQAELHVTAAPPPSTARIRFVVRDTNSGHVGTADAAI